MPTQAQLQAFTELAKSQGYGEDEIASFAKLAETAPVEERDLTFDEQLSRDVKKREAFGNVDIGLEAKNRSLIDSEKEVEPDYLQQVYDQNGGVLLSGLKTLTEKEAMARSIIGMGGVEGFRKQAPLSVLLESNDVLKKANDSADILLGDVNAIQRLLPPGTKTDIFGKGNLTGPIAGRMPEFLSSDERIKARQAIGTLFTQRAKEMSGVAINPEELKRMESFLPSNKDQERTVALKADQMDKAIRMNMKVREDALRSGMTIGELWKANKAAYYQEFGFGLPEIKGNQSQLQAPQNSEDLVNKYWQ